MKHASPLLLAAICVAGCSSLGGSVAGTYHQESTTACSFLLTKIELKNDKTFEMSGFVDMKGTYVVTGTDLTLTATPNVPNTLGAATLKGTIQGGTIELNSSLPNTPSLKFRKK